MPVECQESIIEISDGGKVCETGIMDATSSRLQTLEETKLSSSALNKQIRFMNENLDLNLGESFTK